MTQKPQSGLSQGLTHLSLNPARNTNRTESPVCSLDAIESPTLAFLDEVFAIGRFGADELSDGGEGVIGVLCFLAAGFVLAQSQLHLLEQ